MDFGGMGLEGWGFQPIAWYLHNQRFRNNVLDLKSHESKIIGNHTIESILVLTILNKL